MEQQKNATATDLPIIPASDDDCGGEGPCMMHLLDEDGRIPDPRDAAAPATPPLAQRPELLDEGQPADTTQRGVPMPPAAQPLKEIYRGD